MYLIPLDNIPPRFKGEVTWIHRMIHSDDFSATQLCIIKTVLQPFETMSHCNTVLC